MPVLRVNPVQRDGRLFTWLLWSLLLVPQLLEGRRPVGVTGRRPGPGPGVRGLCFKRRMRSKGRRELHGQMGTGKCLPYRSININGLIIVG